MIARQGDILFKSTNLGTSAPRVKVGKSVVIAEGEKTGHKHVLTSTKPIEVTKTFGDQIARVILAEPGEITHDEHGTVTLEAGTYDVVREQELDHADRKLYDVVD